MNNDINRENIFAISITIFLAILCLCGCIDNQKIDNSLNNFIGTWTGSMEVSNYSGFMDVNRTFNELIFTQDLVIVTFNTEQGNITMNYTYVVNGNKLVLEPLFSGKVVIPGRQPFNENITRPLFNDTRVPPNGTQPPFNNTWLPNNEQPPSGQKPLTMSLSFSYRFDENYTVLYLDATIFKKVTN